MKKTLCVVITVVIFLSAFAPTASATGSSPLPIDITNQVKCSTVYEIYSQKLPVVRLDAVFVGADEYDAALAPKAPSGSARTVNITNWNLPMFFDDPFNLGDGVFYYYTCKWANVVDASDKDDRAPLTYYITIDKAGTYEFVFVGCAEVTEAELGDPSKDRGFTYSIDGGQMYQVNTSGTKGTFRGYNYNYTMEQAAEDIVTEFGVNSQYYQVAYYYNITAELTAGKHTIVYSDLYYSGDESQRVVGNEGRLNYMGFYYQPAISDYDWLAYTYPEIITTEAPATTKAVTTKAPGTTKAATTKAPETSPAPTTDAQKPPVTTASPEGGCGSSASLGAIALLMPAALIIRKKKD